MPARLSLVLPLAALAHVSSVATPAAEPGPPPPASPLFASASLSLTPGASVLICQGELTFDHSGSEPCFSRIPLPFGRLATQDSPTGASLRMPEEPGREPAQGARVDLPGTGRHQIRFELHIPARKAGGCWEATIPHPGATVCQAGIQTPEGYCLLPGSVPGGVRDGDTLLTGWPPFSKPILLRWHESTDPHAASGISVQKSLLHFTLSEGVLLGRMELRGDCDSPSLPSELRCSLPPGCIPLSVTSDAVLSWRTEERGLVLHLLPAASPGFRMTLHTASPIDSPDATIPLPLPRFHPARRVEGSLTLQTGGRHFITDLALPPGFVPRTHQFAPDPKASADPLPALSYDFFSLDEGATGALTLFQPETRVRSYQECQIWFQESEAKIERVLRIQAENAPLFTAQFQIATDERIAGIHLLQGDAEIRRQPAGRVALHWSRGLPPGKAAVLEVTTRKPLFWNQETAIFRLEPLRLPHAPTSGSLTLYSVRDILVRPVRNLRLRPVPARDLPPEARAAWHHDEFDALVMEFRKRQPLRTSSLVSSFFPLLSGPRMKGELRIDPGELSLDAVELNLLQADARAFRVHSPLVSAIELKSAPQTIRVALLHPQTSPFTLPWELALPAPEIQVDAPRKRASFEVPQFRTPGFRLESNELSVVCPPFSKVQFDPQGFDPLPPTDPTSSELDEPQTRFIAASPSPALRVLCEETGSEPEPAWEIESLALISQISASAPQRHRCRFVLPGSKLPRILPVVLPPRSVLVSGRIQDRRLIPLESPANPLEFLVPLPSSPESVRLELDYLTEGPAWGGSGEMTVAPPALPEGTLTQHSEWTLELPREFAYSDFQSSLLSPGPPPEPPLTLRPFRSLLTPAAASESKTPLSFPAPTLELQGDFTPPVVSFHYRRGERQLAIALLWVLAGMAAFFVFARERPWYFGAFGLILLTFLPLSGIANLGLVSDGLLLGWIAGGIAFAGAQILKTTRKRTPFTKPMGALPFLLSGLAVCHPDPSLGQSHGLPFDRATHRVEFTPSELRVKSSYRTAATRDSENPLRLDLPELDSLAIDGIPLNRAKPLSLPRGAAPQTIEAHYRVFQDPGSRVVSWTVSPAKAAVLIIAGLPEKRSVQINENLPAVRQPDGALAAALGAGNRIELAIVHALPPLDFPPAPRKALSRVACGVFPGSLRLDLDLTLEHPGRSLDLHSLEFPRTFRLIRAGGSRSCRVTPSPENRDVLQLEWVPERPGRDRTTASFQWEAPLRTGLNSLPCPLPLPDADLVETSFTLAAVPPVRASLRNGAQLPGSPPFLPASWGDAARVAAAVRVTGPPPLLWVDLQRPPGQGELDLTQLYVAGNGSGRAFCLAQLRSGKPWFSTAWLLDPAVRVRSVSGAALLDWSQTETRLSLRRRPSHTTWDPLLLSFDWDSGSLSDRLPFPLFTAPGFALGDSETLLACGPEFRFLDSGTGSAAAQDASPFRLSPPLQVRAKLNAPSKPGEQAPRLAATPPLFQTSSLVAISLEAQHVLVELRVDIEPQDATLDSLSIQIPGHVPALSWAGPHLRESQVESSTETDVHLLRFSGPIDEPVSYTGTAAIPMPASSILRIPLPSIPTAAKQARFAVIRSRDLSQWKVQAEGLKEISPRELPRSRHGPGSALAFTAVAEAASVSLAREPASPPEVQTFPAILDLHLSTQLRLNGNSSHVALAWLLPPPDNTLPFELPPRSVLTRVQLNGQPVPARSLAEADAGSPGFLLSLPSSLSRKVPSLLEIAYSCFPEGAGFSDQRRIAFRFEAPRVGSLPVTQTAWQVRALDGFSLRLGEGNLYELTAPQSRLDRFESLTALARELQRSLRQEPLSAEESALLRNRILALTSFAASRWPDSSIQTIVDEARLIRGHAAQGDAVAGALAPPAALVGPWAAVDRAFEAADQPAGATLRTPSLPIRPHGTQGVFLSDQVALDPGAVPWLAREEFVPHVSAFPARAAAAWHEPGGTGSQQQISAKTAPPASTLFSVPVEFPPPSSASVFFKKLKGDARLHLIATPVADPLILKSWLGFAAALAILSGLSRLSRRGGGKSNL